MTRAHHLCDESADYKGIRAIMNRVFVGEEGSAIAREDLRQVYPEGIPKVDAWRRAMARGVEELRLTPNGAKFLKDLQVTAPRLARGDPRLRSVDAAWLGRQGLEAR